MSGWKRHLEQSVRSETISRQSVAYAVAMLLSAGSYFYLPASAYAGATTEASPTGHVQHYDIAAGQLAPALRSLASSANVLLTFTDAQTAGKTTAGIAGQYTLPAALSALLSGTGLEAVALDTGGYVLRPVAKMSGSADTLPEVQVTAKAGPGVLPSAYAGGRLPRVRDWG
ncbi:outer-membrane receptor for ferric coprogen and ferric-rhodotorulic acid [Methylobacillus rhizosphaerae]|uniref:Outer-membrane receptor for ferric coprogen and ferric-rhodotorulic acid n=1 Tax=Methylobacillus rhizosphaerae TaxID=551994 RepID=A0A238XMA4_9PROT|nr:STN domain-containing protein [Methylobacillus rhizosphaerae]SNR60067.1 outer-membrane receptor for ferric coprogen and ferric-rhodotorulic acid [Methylobacillus rhizosphaerae]